LVAALGAILNPVLVGIVSGIGGTIGEMTGYLLGYGGRLAVENIGIYTRMVQWMKRWGSVTIFVLALIPNPLFDVAGAAAGSLRFPVWKFILFGAAGRIPKNIFFAYIGVWGLHFLPL
jgi:membrane protein YqaA with SNARE-associated domain